MQNRSPLRSPFAIFIAVTFVGSSAIYSILRWQAIWFLISIFLYTLFYIAAFGWRPLVHWMWITGLALGIGLIAGGFTVTHVLILPKETAIPMNTLYYGDNLKILVSPRGQVHTLERTPIPFRFSRGLRSTG
jgi:energy-coupling factor transporter transmembrane protein EcfT